MARVRVPKELRPPERFKPFAAPGQDRGEFGSFKVKGVFRNPKDGEYFWSQSFGGSVLMGRYNIFFGPRVILERVK